MNCLAYALEYWAKHAEYGIYYDGDHVVNLKIKGKFPKRTELYYAVSMLPLLEYGYDNIKNSFQNALSPADEELLKRYFEQNKV